MAARCCQLAVIGCLAFAACGLGAEAAAAADDTPAPGAAPTAEPATESAAGEDTPVTEPAEGSQPPAVPIAEAAPESAEPAAAPDAAQPAAVPEVARPEPLAGADAPEAAAPEPVAPPQAPAVSASPAPQADAERPRHQAHGPRGSAEVKPARRRARRTQRARPVYFEVAPTSPEGIRGAGAQGIVAADLDGDGDVDLAVPHYYGGMSVLLNTGKGDFRLAESSPRSVGEFPWAVAAADFDGDGDLDLAITNLADESPHNPQGRDFVVLLLNDGRANFRTPPGGRLPTGDDSYSIAAGDLDADGDADLLVLNQESRDLTILLNDGHASFAERPGEHEEAPAEANNVALADLDGDGDLDAVATDWQRGVTFLLNDGHADFERSPNSLPDTETYAEAMTTADVDGDGDIDVILGGLVTVLLNDGTGRFTSTRMRHHGAARFLAAGDLDGDGDPDLVYGWANTIFSGRGERFLSAIGVLLNDGRGHFSEPGHSPREAPNGGYEIALADLDADGDLDLAFGTEGGVAILLNVDHPPLRESRGGGPRREPEADERRRGEAGAAVPAVRQIAVAALSGALPVTGYPTALLFALGCAILTLGGLLGRRTRRG